MKYLLHILLISLFFGFSTSCVEQLNDTQFKVSCTIDPSLHTDSVSLLMFEDLYNRVYHFASVSIDSSSGAFIFEGQIERPCVAFLKFDNDTIPFFFVLEKGETAISINSKGVVVTAGELNHEYFSFLKSRMLLQASRRALYSRYLTLASPDSIVNIQKEREFVTQDSLLADSLDRITLDAINRGSLASRIIFDRFVNELSPYYLKKIVNINKITQSKN